MSEHYRAKIKKVRCVVKQHDTVDILKFLAPAATRWNHYRLPNVREAQAQIQCVTFREVAQWAAKWKHHRLPDDLLCNEKNVVCVWTIRVRKRY